MDSPHHVKRATHLEHIKALSTPLKIPPSPFMKNLGYGTGVNVYRMERSPKCGEMRSPWAVKRVSQRIRATDPEIFNARIQKEAEILRKLSHPNIVGFRAITKTSDGTESLVLECCKTSLGSILEEHNDDDLGPLPAKETLKMIVDISKALDYLHTEAKLLHGDLKSHNVLVKGDFEICKLCDFGVSLPIDDKGVVDFAKNPNLRYVGTDLWSAPEVMDESEVIDCKVDMFSFGLIVYETLALVPPHSLNMTVEDDSERKENISNTNMLAEGGSLDSTEVLEEEYERVEAACGTRPLLPQAFELGREYNRIVEIFYCCTNELPEDRPSAKSLWQSLMQMEEKEGE